MIFVVYPLVKQGRKADTMQIRNETLLNPVAFDLH